MKTMSMLQVKIWGAEDPLSGRAPKCATTLSGHQGWVSPTPRKLGRNPRQSDIMEGGSNFAYESLVRMQMGSGCYTKTVFMTSAL